ncbi:MAG: hypothetical protein HC884_02015 [Chloroflexaceae bacterium]|nr:hypothetical protein [Chloroflexaceae bacterium]
MNFREHFFDESLGSGQPDEHLHMTEQGDYLCIQPSGHPLHVYQRVGDCECLHPSVARLEYNGHTYKLAWIEDDRW